MNHRQKLVQKQFLNNEEAVIKRLKQVYKKSLSDIEDKIKNLQFDIGRLQAEYDWLDPKDPEAEKIKSQIQSKIYQKKYQEQLQKQLDGILKQMQREQYLTVSGYLNDCYTDGFIGSIFDLSGQGVPLMMPIDQQSMVHAVQLDSKISHGLYTRLGEDVDLLKKKITAQVSRCIATGESFAQMAKHLKNASSIGYNNAIRIARTEGHRIQTTATMDAMYGAKERGADVVKQWDAALDARTRDSHVKVDGEWKEIDEKFSNGLMFPGDPHGAAAEVINCRCALLQRARLALADGFTKIDGFTDEIKSFDSMETYDQFKKAYFSPENRAYMSYVNELEERYGKDFNKILSKMTDDEYKYFSKLEKARPQFSGMYRVGGSSDEISEDGLTFFNSGGKIDLPKSDYRIITGEHSIDDDIGSPENPICNPKYKTRDVMFTYNCGNCSTAFEMRRRGFDVIAKPRNKMFVTEWQQLFEGATPFNVPYEKGKKYVETVKEKILANGEEGARGSIYVKFAGKRVGHFFSWEVKDGKVCFVDAQNGNTSADSYFDLVKPSETICLRWDNLKPSEAVKDSITNRGGE